MSILFGKYSGISFEFFIQNDLGYVIYILASEQTQQETNRETHAWKAENKASLWKYAALYPEVMTHVQEKILDLTTRDENRSCPLRERKILFGKFKGKMYKDLLTDIDCCKWLKKQKPEESNLQLGEVQHILKDLEDKQPSKAELPASGGQAKVVAPRCLTQSDTTGLVRFPLKTGSGWGEKCFPLESLHQN